MTAATADDLCVDNTEIVAGPAGATPVSNTAAYRVTNLISSNEAFSGSDSACSVPTGAAGFFTLTGEIAHLVDFKKPKEITGHYQWGLLIRALRPFSLLSSFSMVGLVNVFLFTPSDILLRISQLYFVV